MLVAFNKYGTVIRQLTHGTPARQGVSSGFEIVCYFSGRTITNSNLVTIQFRKPSGEIIANPIVMNYDSDFTFNRLANDDINTTPFVNGGSYPVHYFTPDINSVFDEYGVYEATVSVYTTNSASSPKLVEGMIKIPVQRSAVSLSEGGIIHAQSYIHYVTVGDENSNCIYIRIISDSDEPINTPEKLYNYLKDNSNNLCLGGTWEYDPVSFQQWYVTNDTVLNVRMSNDLDLHYVVIWNSNTITQESVEARYVIDYKIKKI